MIAYTQTKHQVPNLLIPFTCLFFINHIHYPCFMTSLKPNSFRRLSHLIPTPHIYFCTLHTVHIKLSCMYLNCIVITFLLLAFNPNKRTGLLREGLRLLFEGPEGLELGAQKVVLTKWKKQGVIIWAYFITHLLFLHLV